MIYFVCCRKCGTTIDDGGLCSDTCPMDATDFRERSADTMEIRIYQHVRTEQPKTLEEFDAIHVLGLLDRASLNTLSPNAWIGWEDESSIDEGFVTVDGPSEEEARQQAAKELEVAVEDVKLMRVPDWILTP